MSYNRIVIHGRLATDPVLKTTQSGISVTAFTVAVDRRYKSGEDKITDFFSVTAWRELAKMVCKYFAKGKEIIVAGEMQSRNYTDKSGNSRIAWEISADEVDFCGSKNDTAQKPSEPKFEKIDTDDDLPF